MNHTQWWLYGGLGIAALMMADEFGDAAKSQTSPNDNGIKHELELHRLEGEGGPPL